MDLPQKNDHLTAKTHSHEYHFYIIFNTESITNIFFLIFQKNEEFFSP